MTRRMVQPAWEHIQTGVIRRKNSAVNEKQPTTTDVDGCFKKVGATRFERATSCSQSRRSSQAELRPDKTKRTFDC